MQEIEEPTLLQTVRGHRSEVTCADASGAWLVTGGGDRALRLWRWEPGAGWDEVARCTDAHRYSVTAARWAASGALLASCGVDGVARVWAGRSLRPRRLLAAPGAAAARALCWAARARLLVGHDDGALCVWHVARGQQLARLHAHEGALHAVAAPAGGALLLTACTHGVLKVFDLADVCRSGCKGESSSPVPLAWMDNVHDLGALCAAATEDGSMAATGGQDAAIRVWHTRAEDGWPRGLLRAGYRLSGHSAAVTALRWAGWGAAVLLASAALDRTARLWRPAGPQLHCVRVVHAHPRYLTCVVLAHDMRYMLTGSNDRSLRMWSLGSLTLDDELETPCEALAHFGLGDLKGIGPLDDEVIDEDGVATQTAVADRPEGQDHTSLQRLWSSAAHSGAINDIATHGDLVATASSDGMARVFRWCEESGELETLHELAAHEYPVLAVDFVASGAVLLTAGLDGRACLWDVESGVQLRSLCVPAGEDGGAGGEAGGGGVRAARASTQRAALILLATDDGLAPLWSLDDDNPQPLHVFGGECAALTCCGWARDAALCGTGSAAGELRLLAPPPHARLLHYDPQAHDLEGVQSLDFAPSASELELGERQHVLATAGGDSRIKLWLVSQLEGDVAVRAALTLELHGGGASCVRWGAGGGGAGGGGAGGGGAGGGGAGGGGALLAAAGADHAARVWRVAARGRGAVLLAVVSVGSAGGVLAVALLGAAPQLVAGSLAGELAVWRLPRDLPDDGDDEEGTPACFWNREGVSRWLRDCVSRVPGAELRRNEETSLTQRCQQLEITGTMLLSTSIDALLETFGFDINKTEDASEGASQERMREELQWLRAPPPSYQQEVSAPHWLRCPLSHRLLREPVFAADGYSYERANILDWFLAADSAVSPVSGRRLLSRSLQPNYALRDQLRDFLRS